MEIRWVRTRAGRLRFPLFRREAGTLWNAAVDGPAEFQYAPNHLFGGFQHYQLLPGR
jgi:hypothetical protein